jgi:uncharacterized protein YndB with AHSA1/START domain
MTLTKYKIDPKLDLVLERIVDVPRELVWKAWTTPEYLKKWFTVGAFTTVDCTIDLRPGGLFHIDLRSPEGDGFSNDNCFLEIVENERLIWTDALVENYRPALEVYFTGVVLLEPHGTGTKYTVIAMHKNEEDRNGHEAMQFQENWSKSLDQLVELVKAEAR